MATGLVVVSGWDNYLTIINAEDPTDLRLLTRTGDESLTVINISNPAAPAFAGVIRGTVGGGPPNWLWGAYGVIVLGDYAYVTAAGDDSVTVIDISDPLNPTFVSSFRGAGAPNYLDLVQGLALITYTAAPLVQTDPATEIT